MTHSFDREMSFGNWIQKRRKSLDMTREELASRAGCSVSALRKIEAGERLPSKQLAGLLAVSLEIPTEEREQFIQFARGALPGGSVRYLAPPQPILDVANDQAQPKWLSRLPVPSNLLLGREAELAILLQRFSDPCCRLLTITGLSGTGKTRLAIELARRLQNEFNDGVFYISLTSLSSASHLIPGIANGTGLQISEPGDIKTQLLARLAQKSLLLVLDNFECLLDSADLLTEIIQHTASVKILVTSTERLCLKDEWVFELEGLSVPDTDQREELHNSPSTALFTQTAQRVQAGFEPSHSDLLAIARICRLLDGLPLGIELAASCLPFLSCNEIAHEIELSLDFLSSRLRDIPQRQRSLRAVFDYSWNKLSTGEQHLLESLTIFQNAFDRQAAEQVCGANLLILNSLVAKSLIHKTSENRFELHELIRLYASERFQQDASDLLDLQAAHARYYLTMLAAQEAGLTSSHQKETINQLVGDIDNFHQAWLWAARSEDIALLKPAIWSLWYILEVRGLYRQGELMLETALRYLPFPTSTVSGFETVAAAQLSYLHLFPAFLELRLGKVEAASEILRDCLTAIRAVYDNPQLSGDNLGMVNDSLGLSSALWMNGVAHMIAGQFQVAGQFLEEAYLLAQETRRLWEQAISALLRSRVALLSGDRSCAEHWLFEGTALSQSLGDPIVGAFAMACSIDLKRLSGESTSADSQTFAQILADLRNKEI